MVPNCDAVWYKSMIKVDQAQELPQHLDGGGLGKFLDGPDLLLQWTDTLWGHSMSEEI